MSDNIPLEVQMDILQRLPVKQVLRCRSVCKTWKSCIDTNHFIVFYGVKPAATFPFVLCYKQRFKGYHTLADENFALTTITSNLNYSDLTPIGWSNGVCGFTYGPIVADFMAIVFNPSIKRSAKNLFPNMTVAMELEKCLLGFGVSQDTLDQTIIKIAYPNNPQKPVTVLIHTFSSREWRILEPHLLPPPTIKIKKTSQANIGDLIFWCGYERVYANNGVSCKVYYIVSFDLVTHRFQLLDIPDELLRQIPLPFLVSSLGNNLVISGNIDKDSHYDFCIWVLTLVGGTVDSFTRLLKVPTPCKLKLLGFEVNNNPIIEVQHQEGFPAVVVRYRLATGNFQNLGINGDVGSFFLMPYCHSLLMVDHEDAMIY